QRLFKEYIGVSPKWVIDRYRMIAAVEALNDSADSNLTELAHRLGYFDQAHFSKAFSALTGLSPSQCRADCSPPASGRGNYQLGNQHHLQPFNSVTNKIINDLP